MLLNFMVKILFKEILILVPIYNANDWNNQLIHLYIVTY
jgi:hypothetical protein